MRAGAQAEIAVGNERWTEWETAFHEAGHVVVEVATGSYPDQVYLNDGGRFGADHAGRTAGRSFLGAEGARNDQDERVAAWGEAECRRYAAVLAAGSLSTDLACGSQLDLYDRVSALIDDDEEPMGTDGSMLRALVVGMAPGHAEMWLEEAFAEAERLLRERWADVERVAQSLVERRRLDREDLWELLPHRGLPPSRVADVWSGA